MQTNLLANHDATCEFMDRTVVLIECDKLDDDNSSPAQVTLTRLHNMLQTGHALGDNDMDTIRELTEHLGIKNQKRVAIQRSGRENSPYSYLHLSESLGPYYTKISIPYEIYCEPAAAKIWDDNPIEICEISMIPPGAKVENLRSHRLSRCGVVTLHFESGTFNQVFSLLTGLKCYCSVLELRNANLTPAGLKVLEKRLQWPHLRRIIHTPRNS